MGFVGGLAPPTRCLNLHPSAWWPTPVPWGHFHGGALSPVCLVCCWASAACSIGSQIFQSLPISVSSVFSRCKWFLLYEHKTSCRCESPVFRDSAVSS